MLALWLEAFKDETSICTSGINIPLVSTVFEKFTFAGVFNFFKNLATPPRALLHSEHSFSKRERPLKIYFPLYSRKGWRNGSERMGGEEKKDRNVHNVRGRRGKSIDLFAVYRSNKEFKRRPRTSAERGGEPVNSLFFLHGPQQNPGFPTSCGNGNCKNTSRTIGSRSCTKMYRQVG